MISRIKTYIKVIGQMGPRYSAYRVRHLLESKLGVLKRRHPSPIPAAPASSLADFRQNAPAFFFDARHLGVVRKPCDALAREADQLRNGVFAYFSAETHRLNDEAPWHTHPITGQQFPAVHWSKVPDFDPALGDVKYVSGALPLLSPVRPYPRRLSQWS